MPDELVTYELDGDVARIGLNRTAKRNALSADLQRDLLQASSRAIDEAKVALVYAHGDHFCGGLDLVEAAQWMGDPDGFFRLRMRGVRPFDQIANAPIPFVAAISGACVGGGLEIATCCHLRVADETAFFALPEGQRGIYIGGGGSVRVARVLGLPRMTDMMLTGRVLNAADAERHGLVQYVTPKGGHLAQALSIAQRIAQNTERTNWAIVAGLRRIQDMSHDDGLFVEGLLANAATSKESDERLQDFINKRAAPITDRSKFESTPN